MAEASLQFVADGVITPLTTIQFASAERKGSFNGGVYLSNRSVCALGLQRKGGYENIPDPAEGWNEQPLAETGNAIFCGMLQNEHFGHFISESLSRIWAATHLGRNYGSLAFYLRHINLPIAPFVEDTLRLIVPHHQMTIVRVPTRFEAIAVPEQLTYGDSGFVYGHPFLRSTLAPLRALRSNDKTLLKVYVSRSRLDARDGGIIHEKRLDDYFRAEGYSIVYPETLTVRQQFELYNDAQHIIFSEGSALHMYALVARPTQNVYVIWRRERHPQFSWQIQSFGGRAPMGDAHIRMLWIPAQDHGNPVHARALLDFGRLHAELLRLGFIAGDRAWDQPSEASVDEELAEFGRISGYHYIPQAVSH
ncbi:glycosyltransferase family 61 protein [Acetobacteraceae bacterium KSS8]|uniref:Glycosyltransferase family 61 protein n=1 Tax=Endosaccharibacter trunci TaxID=2812733 RepID=A0ABT1WAN0_9PROT|nr:glycosyltransferase family 61 protein [Acetobacteraceae bacterium KSS8]